MSLGPEDILALLPHRYPFILVDRIQEIQPDQYAIGVKNVSLNEPFFQGHFPHYRVMPGVLIVEAMAQVAGVLVGYSKPRAVTSARLPLLAGVDRCRFRRQVVPGDQLVIRLEVIRRTVYSGALRVRPLWTENWRHRPNYWCFLVTNLTPKKRLNNADRLAGDCFPDRQLGRGRRRWPLQYHRGGRHHSAPITVIGSHVVY